MKTSSALLWKLIQSMSPGEKLFFKRNYTNNPAHRKSIYVQLFDVIARQAVYDEEQVLKKLGASISRKNLASHKHYLQEQLTEALLQFDCRNEFSHEIYRDIQLVRVYRKKGLLDEAHLLWKKAVLKARKSESYPMLSLLKSEFGKMILFSGNHTPYDELYSLFKGNIISYNEYAEMITLRDIYTEILLLKRKTHYDLDEPLKARVETLLERVYESELSYPINSFWFRHYLRMNKATLLYMLNEIPESLDLLKQVREDWKLHPQYLLADSEYYIELLYMINYAGILNGSFSYVENVFSDPYNEGIGHAQRANFEAIKFLALNKIYNKTGRYDQVAKLLDSMKSKYRQWEPVMNADLNRTLTFSLGISSFVLEKYSDALYFTKRGVTYFRDGTREEQRAVGHLLVLMTSFMMNNARLFDTQYRSTYAYFHKRAKKQSFETLLVRCLHRSFYMKDTKEKINCYRQTIALLESSRQNKLQQMAFNIFNFPGWLSSMIMRIPYRVYVQEQLKNLPANVP